MLPVDLMVELLMVQASSVEDEGGICHWIEISKDGDCIQAVSREGLREGIREYLETLISAPKLLSECEEYENVTTQGETVVYRVGKDVYRSVDNMWVGYAENVQVRRQCVNERQ
jgi:hypothetical protein